MNVFKSKMVKFLTNVTLTQILNLLTLFLAFEKRNVTILQKFTMQYRTVF